MKKTVLLLLVLLVTVGLLKIGNVAPVEASPLEISDFMQEITPPTSPRGIGVNSTGAIYCGDNDGNLWLSTDNGASWNCIFNDVNTTGRSIDYIFVDSNDNVFFVPVWEGVYKYNGTITKVLDPVGRTWHWDEHSNGSIYFNMYMGPNDAVYRTNDQGESWSIVFNPSALGFNIRHIHTVKVNPDNGNIYVASGDLSSESTIWRYTDSWSNIGSATIFPQTVTDFWFKDNYVYIGPDNENWHRRMPYGGIPLDDSKQILYIKEWRVGGSPDYVKWGEAIDDIMVFTTYFGKIWASWDGEHWVMLYNGGGLILDVPENRASDYSLVFADYYAGKIVKFFVDADVLKHLFYKDYTTAVGDLVTIEQIVRNGTNYLDLAEYGVKNANITLIGQAHDNIVSNGTFEYPDGDGKTFAGWKVGNRKWSNVHANTTYSYHGSTSVRHFTLFSGQALIPPEFAGNWTDFTPEIVWQPKKSAFYVISFYVRSNVTDSEGISLIVQWRNSTDSGIKIEKFSTNSTWVNHASHQPIPSWATEINIRVNSRFDKMELFYDDFQIEYYSSTVYETNGLNRQYLTNGLEPWTFTETHIETSDPTVTVGSQSFSHSGELANATESQTWSIDITAGIIKFQTTVYGSGQVKVKVQGTKALSISGALIRNKIADDLYNGTYYGTVTIATDENYIILLSDSKTTITSATLTTDKLTFTLAGYSGYTSTTKVYCGSKGEPKTVTGATSWSYNSATKICTLTVTHSSIVEVTLDWRARIPGDVNGDGIVDRDDLALVDEAYGKEEGEPGYNPDADLNGDGVVDIYDLAECGKNYGETYC